MLHEEGRRTQFRVMAHYGRAMGVERSGRRLIWPPALFAGQARVLLGAEVDGAPLGEPPAETLRAGRSEPLVLARCVVLVHGLWHDPGHFDLVANGLRAAGIEVVMPELHRGCLVADTAAVQAVVDQMPSGPVVLGHSHGGSAITEPFPVAG